MRSENTGAKVEEVVRRWVEEGYCRVEEILILSPHSTNGKSSLAGCSKIGEWIVGSAVVRRPGELSFLSINKAKGLDSLAVIIIDINSPDKLTTAQEQMNYFMGASRARQLLAILHKDSGVRSQETTIGDRLKPEDLRADVSRLSGRNC